MRWTKILTAAAPFFVLNLAFMQVLPTLERGEPLLLFSLGALVVAGWSARAEARWSEIVAGYALALAPSLHDTATLWLSLLFCAPGLFLAPALSGPVRAASDVSLPAGKVVGVAIAVLIGMGVLLGGYQEWEAVVVGVALMAGFLQLGAAVAGIVLTLYGKAQEGAWLGAVAGAAFLMAFGLALQLVPPQKNGRGIPPVVRLLSANPLRTVR